MIIVGLTGSIGMGKTTAGRMLRSMGLFVHESDQAVHNFLDPNGEAFENIALTFPECWDKKNRIIKKDILSDLIFSLLSTNNLILFKSASSSSDNPSRISLSIITKMLVERSII